MKKIRLGILFGGKSAEHEVSVESAKRIIEYLDKDKYDIVPIAIDRAGAWQLIAQEELKPLTAISHTSTHATTVTLVGENQNSQLLSLADRQPIESLDVVFPVLHGPMGEDGTIQGLLTLVNIPFVGAGVLGSAVGMDKDVMKRLLREAGIPTPRCQVLTATTKAEVGYNDIAKELGQTLFIKPANLGSSVGVYKVTNAIEFDKAVESALNFDQKILIEEYIDGREIECSVLGNEEPIASLPGEVVVNAEFYSYEAKYLDENGATFNIPAHLSDSLIKNIQDLAVKTFTTLCCSGMARVDFFVTSSGDVYVNEINTIPGFTKISMYPKLWEASGLERSALLDRLIELAIERHQKQQSLRTSYQ